jgi:hypothetical protein
MIWLAVADMTETLHQVTAHGGGILEPPAPDGPARTLATIIDPEGNPIGLAGHGAGPSAGQGAGPSAGPSAGHTPQQQPTQRILLRAEQTRVSPMPVKWLLCNPVIMK